MNSIEGTLDRPIQKHRITQWQAKLEDPKFALNGVAQLLHESDDFAACAKPQTAEFDPLQEVHDRWRNDLVRRRILFFSESHRFHSYVGPHRSQRSFH